MVASCCKVWRVAVEGFVDMGAVFSSECGSEIVPGVVARSVGVGAEERLSGEEAGREFSFLKIKEHEYWNINKT